MTRKQFRKATFTLMLAALSLNAVAIVPSDDKKIKDISNPYYGKTYSVMGDSIGTDNEGDTPLFTITAKDVGKPMTTWVTWYDYNNSREDEPSGTTKTIGGVTITEDMVGTQQTFTPDRSDIGKTLGTPRFAYNGMAGVGITPWWKLLGDKTFPMNNTYHTMQEYNKAIKDIAEYMGCSVIDFSKCWTFYNCVSGGYVNPGDFTHPTQKGHEVMCSQALKDLL